MKCSKGLDEAFPGLFLMIFNTSSAQITVPRPKGSQEILQALLCWWEVVKFIIINFIVSLVIYTSYILFEIRLWFLHYKCWYQGYYLFLIVYSNLILCKYYSSYTY